MQTNNVVYYKFVCFEYLYAYKSMHIYKFVWVFELVKLTLRVFYNIIYLLRLNSNSYIKKETVSIKLNSNYYNNVCIHNLINN